MTYKRRNGKSYKVSSQVCHTKSIQFESGRSGEKAMAGRRLRVKRLFVTWVRDGWIEQKPLAEREEEIGRNNVPKCSEQVWETVRWYTHKQAANSQTCKTNLKKKSKNKLLGD